jgi:hypothetical protein
VIPSSTLDFFPPQVLGGRVREGASASYVKARQNKQARPHPTLPRSTGRGNKSTRRGQLLQREAA